MSEHDPSAQEKRSLGERIRRLYLAVRRHGFTVLLLAMGVAITAMVRYTLLEYRSADMDGFILPWCDAIAKKGFAGAFKDGGIDYNPTYIYFLWIAAKLPVDRMLAVKAFTIFCDYASALIMALTIRRLCQSWLRALLGAFALLLAPTVVFNGALWGQCDMLYSLLLLWGLAFFVRGHRYLPVIFFGLSIAVKLQAIFLFPLLGIWVLRKQIPWRSLLLLPMSFFLCLVPAWIAGVPLKFLLMIYPNQTGRYNGWLNMSAPGIYNWLPDDGRWFGNFGMWFAVGITFMLTVACMRTKERVRARTTLAEALLFSCVVPFFLPHMHERYVFLGDVLCILYAFVVPRQAWLALLVIGASFFSYFPFLFGKAPVPLGVAAMLLGAVCLFLAYEVLRTIYPGLFDKAETEA